MPVRWWPLTWQYEGQQYFNERPISTPQAGWSYISQLRSWLPNEVSGILWFWVGDTEVKVYVPIYASITKMQYNFNNGHESLAEFTCDSASWIFNFIANYIYPKYSLMINDVLKVQYVLEVKFLAYQHEIQDKALTLSKISKRDTIDFLNDYSNKMADQPIKQWKKLNVHLIQ